MTELLLTLGLLAAGLAAAIGLKQAWTRRDARGPRLILASWALLAAVVIGAGFGLGAARGPIWAIALVPIGALVLVAAGVQRRASRGHVARSRALEPSLRPARVWRGVLRTLVAGPLGCVVALTLGIAWTVTVPGEPQTRIVLGGVWVPLIWAGAMAWALTDDRILRPALSMLGLTLVGGGLALAVGF